MTTDELRSTLRRAFAALAEALSDSPPAGLPPLQATILRHLTTTPQRGKALAQLCGRRYSSSFREALSALVNDGRARRTSHGYSLA